MRRILITGSNRGIGLALVREYLKQADTHIFATCRNPGQATELQTIATQHPTRVRVITLDVANAESIAESRHIIGQQTDSLDMLINNAGILPGGVDNRDANMSAFGQLEVDAMLHVFRVNSISPVMITQAYADLLRKGNQARVINVSSDAGSINRRNGGCDYSYPASKAALNMLTRCLAGDFKADGVIVVAIHPGWIQTEMGGVRAHLTLDEAIPKLVKVMDKFKLNDSSLFFNWDGKKLKW